jgi:hypothetical protein
MAAVKIKDYSSGVAVVANDLLTGRSVYLDRSNSWLLLDGSQLDNVRKAHNEQNAGELLTKAVADVVANIIVDPYLIQLDPSGVPVHIRERLRVSGPSIPFLSTVSRGLGNVSI